MVYSELSPEYKEIYDRLIMPVDTNIKLTDVILSDENKDKIEEFISETKFRDKLYEYGLEPLNRLLFYGASGTGKTFLSKALSNHLGYTMLYIDIAKSLSDGNIAMNISDIFKLANHMKNCIIFFDECDSVAWSRDAKDAESGTIRRATNSIFQHLDQMDHSNIFIAATNMLHKLDAAFERRFNLKLSFMRPKISIDEAMKHFIYPKFKVIDDVDKSLKDIVDRRAKNYVKLSYYELEELVKKGMKRAVLNNTDEVHTRDLYDDLAIAMNVKVRFNTEDDSEEIFKSSII